MRNILNIMGNSPFYIHIYSAVRDVSGWWRVGVDVLLPPGNPRDFIKVWTVQTLVHRGLSYPSVSDGKQNPGFSRSSSRLAFTALLSSDSLLTMDVSSPSDHLLHILTVTLYGQK